MFKEKCKQEYIQVNKFGYAPVLPLQHVIVSYFKIRRNIN